MPNRLKITDIKTVYPKDDCFEKSNCRSISILPML